MKFRRVAILGPGLLGGSIALAAKRRQLAGEIALWGRSEDSLAHARRARVTPHLYVDVASAVAGADLVVLCTPIGVMERILKEALPALERKAVVTDVGSVKAPVVRSLEKLLAGRAHWIGSHPMAGSEQSGFAAARADLFAGSVSIVTPTRRTSPKALKMARRLWTALGCRTLVLDPDAHDRLVAEISHLPHLTAAALVQAASTAALPLIGNGFRDSTRIAAGSPAMWTDILMANRTAVAKALHRTIRTLREVRRSLQSEDEKDLHRFLAAANHVRSGLADPRVPPSRPRPARRVPRP